MPTPELKARIDSLLAEAEVLVTQQPARTIILSEPFAAMVAKAEKTLIVKPRKYDVADEELFFGDSEHIHGVVVLKAPVPLALKDFEKRYDDHRISDDLRRRFWPRVRRFWGYEIAKVESFEKPQSFALPEEASTIISSPQLTGDTTDISPLVLDQPAAAPTKKVGEVMQEAGVHVHALLREENTTEVDGAHTHLFLMPDGTLFETMFGGEHTHSYDEDALRASEGGEHTHVVVLENGEPVLTAKDGGHPHDLLVFTSGVDGLHTHELELPDGETITSLTPPQFLELLEQMMQEERDALAEPEAPVEDLEMAGSYSGGGDRKKKKKPKKSEESVPEVLRPLSKIERFGYLERQVPIHIDKSEEERFVLGIVLEPDVIDGQGDTYSAEEVRKACHYWMEKFARIGHMHTQVIGGALGEAVEKGLVKILENFIARADYSIGELPVKKGTWLLAVRVLDDGLWGDVKEGRLTGFSIGGSAVFEMLDDAEVERLNLEAR